MQRWLGWTIVLAACGGSGGDATGGDAAVVDARDGVSEPAALAGMTLFHNQARAMVDTTGLVAGPLPAFEWDASLAATAAAWLAQCRDTDGDGLVDHNPGRSAGHPWYVGENLFASTGTATAHDAVLHPMYGWTAERVHYHYATNTCDGGATCGHYTQVVWRATQKLGCAIGSCPGLTYPSTIVCDYGPGGNVNNDKPY